MATRCFWPPDRVHAPLSHNRVVPVCEMLDGLIHAGNLCCMANPLLMGRFLCDGDIFPDAPGEQEGLLKHHTDMGSQILSLNIPDIHASDRDPSVAGRQIIEAVQKMHQRRFSAAGASQDSKGASRRNCKTHILQNRMLFIIGEGYMLKADISVKRRLKGFALLFFLLRVEDIGHTLHGNSALLISERILPRLRIGQVREEL